LQKNPGGNLRVFYCFEEDIIRLMRRLRRNKGLGLIEILVALAILAILSGGSYVVVGKQLIRARDSRRKMDLESIRQVLEEKYDNEAVYLESLPGCKEVVEMGESDEFEVPCDPKAKDGYLYEVDEEKGSFKLYAKLEDTGDPVIEALKCGFGCGPDCEYNYGVSSSNVNLDNCMPEPVLYVCGPGAGQEGFCEAHDDPERSKCPKTYPDDPSCNNECEDSENRCKNSSGKSIPD